jgi:MFS family permease
MIHINQFPETMRRNYLIDSIAGMFWGLLQGLVIAFTGVILRRLDGGPLLVAFIALGPCIANLTTLLWAYISTRGNKLLWCVIPTVFSRVILIFSFFVTDPFILTILFYIYFLGEAVSISPYSAVMKEVYPDNYRSQAMGYVRTIAIIATLAGAAAGGKLLDMGGLYSYKLVFPLGGILGVISSLIFSRLSLNSTNGKSENSIQLKAVSKSLKNILTSPVLLYLYSVEFIIGLANLIGIGLYPVFQVDILNLSNSAVGLLSVMSSIGGIMFLYIWGRINVGRVNFSSFKMVLYMVPFIPLLYLTAKNIYPLCIASFIAGMCWNAWDILFMNYLLQSTGNDNIGKSYVSVRYTLMGMRSLMTPLLIKECGNVITGLYLATGLAFLGIILLIRLHGRDVVRGLRRTEILLNSDSLNA